MQENVSVALANCVKLETIEQAAGKLYNHNDKHGLHLNHHCILYLLIEELQQQAGVFKKSAHDLKNKMWWKNIKVCIIDKPVVVETLYFIIMLSVCCVLSLGFL